MGRWFYRFSATTITPVHRTFLIDVADASGFGTIHALVRPQAGLAVTVFWTPGGHSFIFVAGENTGHPKMPCLLLLSGRHKWDRTTDPYRVKEKVKSA